MTFKILMFACLTIMFSCKGSKKSASTTNDSESKSVTIIESDYEYSTETLNIDMEIAEPTAGRIILSLERTPCFGTCATFKYDVYDNGTVLYKGVRFVENEGYYKAMMPVEDFNTIINKAKEVGYFEFENRYPVEGQAPSDLPRCLTMLRTKSEYKKIENEFRSPKKLVEFEKYLEEKLKALELTKIRDLSYQQNNDR